MLAAPSCGCILGDGTALPSVGYIIALSPTAVFKSKTNHVISLETLNPSTRVTPGFPAWISGLPWFCAVHGNIVTSGGHAGAWRALEQLLPFPGIAVVGSDGYKDVPKDKQRLTNCLKSILLPEPQGEECSLQQTHRPLQHRFGG